MGSACGVSWDDTTSGELDESAISNDEYESHYLNAADTKSESSFPVVDADGNLRAGNVDSAWDMRNQGEGVSEECLRKLDGAFEENVLPDTAYENSQFAKHGGGQPDWESGMMVEWRGLDGTGRIVHVPDDQDILMVDVMEKSGGRWQSTGYTLTAGYQDVVPIDDSPGADMNEEQTRMSLHEFSDGAFGMNLEFSALPEKALADGFNKYGVRENDDGSLDVRFKAMEPGTWEGVEITDTFLRNTASYSYGRLPLQLDHSKSQLANAGYIKGDQIQFSDGYLAVGAHIPNTGSSRRDDIIADFTHEPPMIQDISVGFDPRSVEAERGSGNVQFTDARIQEFSLTPFPAGYENGGLTPAFSEAVEKFSNSGCGCDDEGASRLVTRTHTLIEK